MKNFSKLSTLTLLFLLFAQVASPVQAQEKSKKPDPAFRGKATYVDRSQAPFYGKDAVIDTYLADGVLYSVDIVTQDVVEIEPEVMIYKVDAVYNEDQLRGMAEALITDFLGDKVKLDKLSYSLGQKIGTYFFRWEDDSKKLENGSIAFVQVGLSQNGDFLNFFNTLSFVNTLSFERKSPKVQLRVANRPNLIGPFNQIYANDGNYWTRTGTMSSTTGGYCYLYPASWCQPTTFRYKAGNTAGGTFGTWTPQANTNTKAAVFIPTGTNATALATYVITLGQGHGTTTYQVDQNAYSNSWASITVGPSGWGIVSISLQNKGPSTKKFAWDEVWVYNP